MSKSSCSFLFVAVAVLSVAARGDTLAWFRFEELTGSGQAVGTEFADSSGNGRTLVVENFGRNGLYKSDGKTKITQTSVAPRSADGNPEVVRANAASVVEFANVRAIETKGGQTATAEANGTVFRVAETSADRLVCENMTIEFFWNAGGNSFTGWKSFFNRSCNYFVQDGKETAATASPAGLELCLDNGNVIKLKYTCDNGGTPAAVQTKSTSVAIPADSSWHHFAVTFTATAIKFYLDYELKCTQDLTQPLYFGDTEVAPTKKWTFGGNFTGWAMPGKFDEIRISDAALEASQFLRFGQAGRKETVWEGLAGAGGVADWNAAGSWSEGVPVGRDTAVVKPVSVVVSSKSIFTNNVVRLTPPADFSGTVSIKNNEDAIDSPANCRLPVNVALTVLDGAQWTVEGDGVLIATANVDAHVSSNGFTGVIDVPAGVRFAVPATLDGAVRFIGAGELVLSDSAMFDRCALFNGKILFNGSSFSVSQFAQAACGDFTLGDGQALAVDPRTVALGGACAMAPLTDTNAWDMAGATWHAGPDQRPFSTAFPVYDGGDLVIADSPAQHRIVTYRDRKFKLSDIWHVEFTVVPDTSDAWLSGSWNIRPSGTVGVFFSKGTHSGVPMQMLPANADDGIYGGYLYFNRQNDAQGFRWKHTWISQPNVDSWTYGSSIARYPESGIANDVYLERQMDGIDLRRPIDVAVSCEKGVVSFTFRQQGKSFSVIRDYSRLLKVTDSVQGVYQPLKEETGYSLMITGSTDFCPQSVSQTKPWQKLTLRGFRGWYWNRYETPWKSEGEEGFSSIDTQNWKLSTFDGVESLADAEETERCTGTGGYRILKRHANQVTSLHSRNVVSAAEPVLLTFDYTMGDCLVENSSWKYGKSLTFGFNAHDCNHEDAKMTKYSWQPCQTCESGWKNLPSWIMEWVHGEKMQYGFIAGNVGADWTAKWTTADVKAYHCWHTTAHVYVLYDGTGRVYSRFVRPPTEASTGHKSHSPDGNDSWGAVSTGYDGEYAHTPPASLFETFKTQHAGGMHIDIRAANNASGGWNECWIENLKVRKLSPSVPKGAVASVTVAANANASLEAGPAVIRNLVLGRGSRLTMNGGTVAKIAAEDASLAGTPDLTGAITVVAPDSWIAERSAWHTVASLTDVTSALPDPSKVTVVDAFGNIRSDSRVAVRNGRLRVLFGNVGMTVIVR